MSTLFSKAKINLTLEILGKRPDGFHAIRTVFQSLRYGDSISLDWNGEISRIVCENPEVPPDEENLILKGVRLVEEYLGKAARLTVTLDKKIPMGGGLGGGSSNAAAILLALQEKFHIPKEKIFEMAVRLGADVPFFLTGGTALGEGKGEIVRPLPSLPSYPVVMVKPRFSISTREAYARINQYSTGDATDQVVRLVESGRPSEIFRHLKNDFEKALFPVHPELKEIKESFLEQGALASLLCGSGASVFAVAKDENHAESMAECVRRHGEAWVTAMG